MNPVSLSWRRNPARLGPCAFGLAIALSLASCGGSGDDMASVAGTPQSASGANQSALALTVADAAAP